jgi:hypothetical protein
MGDSDDGDDVDPVANGVEDAVRTEADAVSVGSPRELEAALGPRVRGKGPNDGGGSLPILDGG